MLDSSKNHSITPKELISEILVQTEVSLILVPPADHALEAYMLRLLGMSPNKISTFLQAKEVEKNPATYILFIECLFYSTKVNNSISPITIHHRFRLAIMLRPVFESLAPILREKIQDKNLLSDPKTRVVLKNATLMLLECAEYFVVDEKITDSLSKLHKSIDTIN